MQCTEELVSDDDKWMLSLSKLFIIIMQVYNKIVHLIRLLVWDLSSNRYTLFTHLDVNAFLSLYVRLCFGFFFCHVMNAYHCKKFKPSNSCIPTVLPNFQINHPPPIPNSALWGLKNVLTSTLILGGLTVIMIGHHASGLIARKTSDIMHKDFRSQYCSY